MTTINAQAIANSHIAGEIEMRRGHAARSYFKRLGRRQVRRRLDAELRMETGRHLAEAEEMANNALVANDPKGPKAPSAMIIAFPNAQHRAARSVEVVRKVRLSPFKRPQYAVELIAA